MYEKKKKSHFIMIVGVVIMLICLACLCGKVYEVSKENIRNSKSMEVAQQAKDIDYILQQCVFELNLTAGMVEIMIEKGKTNSEILTYLENETQTTTPVFEGNDTGLYGYVRGEYLDGVGWIPDEDYEPTERSWYIAAAEANGETVITEPYVDAQTGLVLMSFAKMLKDKDSVISFDVYLDSIQEQAESISSEIGMEVLVLTDNGLIAASSIKDEIGSYLAEASDSRLKGMSEVYITAGDNDFEFLNEGGSYVVFNKAVYGNWRVLVFQEFRGIFSQFYYLYITAAIVVVLAILYAGMIIFYSNMRRRKAEDISRQLKSIADIYVSMYKLDFVNDACEEKRKNTDIDELIHQSSQKPVDMVQEVMAHLTKGMDQTSVSEISDLSAQIEKMGDSDVMTHEFESINGWIRSRFIVIERKGKQIQSMLWVLENIDKEKKREEYLVREVHRDELTNLFNRKAYEFKLRGYEDVPMEDNLAYIALDVNGLKGVNDNLGHAAGDELLKGAADCIKQCFGRYGIVYRTGGDEFVSIVNVEEALLEGLIKDFEDAAARWSGSIVKELSVSYGYTTTKEFPSATILEIAKIADDRMYEYKRNYYISKGIDSRL